MFIYTADVHLTDKQPINRITPVFPTCVQKLDEILSLAEKHKACLILGGDLFENPCPSYELYNAVINVFDKHDVTTYTVFGNHDVLYGDTQAQNNALQALILSGKVRVLSEIPTKIGGFDVFGVSYRKELYKDFSFLDIKDPSNTIVVTHQFMSDKKLPFNHVNVSDFTTNVRLVLCSHLHDPFDCTNDTGTRFINPGCVCRINRNEEYIDPKCILVNENDIQELSLGFPKAAFNSSEIKKTAFVKSISDAKVEVQDITMYINNSTASDDVKKAAIALIKEYQQ